MVGLEILATAAVGAVVEAGVKGLFKNFTETKGFRQGYANTAAAPKQQPHL